MDEQLRRQLRFSMILQAVAAAMLGVACIARIVISGLDLLAMIFAFGALLAGGFAWFLHTRLANDSRES